MWQTTCVPDLGLKTTRHAIYQTAYHAVWIPKYRKRVLTDALADRLRGLLSEVAQAKGFEILAVAPSLAIQWFKGISARGHFAEFPHLRRVLRRGHLCAPSFYVGTAGQVSAATIRRYIERAEHIRPRR